MGAPEPEPRKITNKTDRLYQLSAQDIRFARLLFNRHATGKSRTDCYVEAGFPAKENIEATRMAASRLVRSRYFREFYRKLQDRAADAAQVDADMIVQGLARVAFASRGKLFDKKGRILPQAQWPADVDGVVEGIETEEVYERVKGEPGQPRRKELVAYVRKVKTSGRVEALKELAKIVGLTGPDAKSVKGGSGAGAAPGPDHSLVIIQGPSAIEPPTSDPEPLDEAGDEPTA